MKFKTYQPDSIKDEGCWFSVDAKDESGAEINIATIEAKLEKDGTELDEENYQECKRRAFLLAIHRTEKLVQALRNEAISLGYDASTFEILNVCLESGEGLDAADRAWRQGYIFNHSGKVHPVPPLTSKK